MVEVSVNKPSVIIYSPGGVVLWMFRDGLYHCNLNHLEGDEIKIELETNNIASYIRPNERQLFITRATVHISSYLPILIPELKVINSELVSVNWSNQDIGLFDHFVQDDPQKMWSIRFEKVANHIREFVGRKG